MCRVVPEMIRYWSDWGAGAAGYEPGPPPVPGRMPTGRLSCPTVGLRSGCRESWCLIRSTSRERRWWLSVTSISRPPRSSTERSPRRSRMVTAISWSTRPSQRSWTASRWERCDGRSSRSATMRTLAWSWPARRCCRAGAPPERDRPDVHHVRDARGGDRRGVGPREGALPDLARCSPAPLPAEVAIKCSPARTSSTTLPTSPSMRRGCGIWSTDRPPAEYPALLPTESDRELAEEIVDRLGELRRSAEQPASR